MYTEQSLYDLLFLMLYGGAAMLALAAAIYLWLRRNNAIATDVIPPKTLRYWTATFFFTVTLSHIWWYVLGVYWLTDDRLVRNITGIMLDHVTLVPLVMVILIRLLQDRQRRIWTWFLAHMPVLVFAAIGITTHDACSIDMMHYWVKALIVVFIIYYIRALLRYGRWLHENYADLEHKEVWQSLVYMITLCVVYEIYSTNPGNMRTEYLSQISTLVIIAFLTWRVETLQELNVKETLMPEEIHEIFPDDVAEFISDDDLEGNASSVNVQWISTQLETLCEDKKLYLQHDLTLQQLALIIGTNRTYLGTYFAQQGITYNTYINRLRIKHFTQLYRESIASKLPSTAQQLALDSGFRRYATFSNAFKNYTGTTVSAWIRDLAQGKAADLL